MGQRPTLIVVGNEKGGSGKSTIAIHVVAGLNAAGVRAAAIDLDHRQQSLSHFYANRAHWIERHQLHTGVPRVLCLGPQEGSTVDPNEQFRSAVRELSDESEVIVIDCPGADTPLGRVAHANASTIVTPLNDSFVDFDVLASVDPESFEARTPSIYAEFVWESRKRQMVEQRRTIDWLVVRNRMSAMETNNKKRVLHALSKLSQRIGFRLASGLSERVIYRELFPKGLTVVDVTEGKSKGLSMSQIAARAEVRALIAALRLRELSRVTAQAS